MSHFVIGANSFWRSRISVSAPALLRPLPGPTHQKRPSYQHTTDRDELICLGNINNNQLHSSMQLLQSSFKT